ncbi:LamG domain-containing protein, partial [Streptomyces sp. TRM76130]|nr:LamG domain-containing protein [Streptomyces sp. TRM76130]
HVAVVIDGRISKLYVNGCEEGRNPTGEAVGVTALDLPFLLGGHQWADAVDQVFHGTVGDVRISGRALEPGQFMNA